MTETIEERHLRLQALHAAGGHCEMCQPKDVGSSSEPPDEATEEEPEPDPKPDEELNPVALPLGPPTVDGSMITRDVDERT